MMATEHIPSSSTLLRGCHRAGAGQCCPDQAFTAGFTSDSVQVCWYGGDRGAQAQLRILGRANQKFCHNTFTVVKRWFYSLTATFRQFSTARYIFMLPVLSYLAVATAIWQPWSRWLEMVPAAAGASGP
jgi:hypothetical protein